MRYINTEEPVAVAVVEAIHTGDLPTLKRLLTENPDLALARLGDANPDGMSRTLLHVATDWPGRFPNGQQDRGNTARWLLGVALTPLLVDRSAARSADV
jgi:hypothetical protein